MNNRYMTYLAVPHINDHVSISCKAFDIVKIMLDFLPVHKSMGILMHGVVSTAPLHLRY